MTGEVVPLTVDSVGDGPASENGFGPGRSEVEAGWHDTLVERFEIQSGAS